MALGKQKKSGLNFVFFCRRFWVKKPRHSENISDENCYVHLYPSMRQKKTIRLKAQLLGISVVASCPASRIHARVLEQLFPLTAISKERCSLLVDHTHKGQRDFLQNRVVTCDKDMGTQRWSLVMYGEPR